MRPPRDRRRAVSAVRRCLCGERRRHVPDARAGVGQGCAAAGAVRSGGRTLLRSDRRQRQGLHRHEQRMRRRGRRHLGDRHRERHRAPCVSWKTNGGSPIGSVAFATNGTAIVAIGPGTVTAGGFANAIVALDPKTLAVKDWFSRPVSNSRRRLCCFRRRQGHRRRHDERRAHSAARCRLSRRRESRYAALRVGVIHGRRRDVRGAVTRDVAGARPALPQRRRRLLLRRRRS